MMFRTISRGLAVAVALAIAVFAVSASTASAEDGFVSITTKGGYAEYNGFDEVLFVSDERKDGYAVKAELKYGKYEQTADVVDGSGADKTPNQKKVSLPENTKVKLRICYVEDLWKPVRCSGWQYTRA